jgi:hypothetical protein
MVSHLRQAPRITIAAIMWSVLIAALGLAASRVLLPGDPEIRLVLVACPVVALGIAAFARWAFTPPTGTGLPPDED